MFSAAVAAAPVEAMAPAVSAALRNLLRAAPKFLPSDIASRKELLEPVEVLLGLAGGGGGVLLTAPPLSFRPSPSAAYKSAGGGVSGGCGDSTGGAFFAALGGLAG